MQIPEDLLLNIVAALPLACAVRCKIVSKQLNRLISSPTFCSLRQRLAPDHTLVVSEEIVNRNLTAFSPRTGQSVSFRAPTCVPTDFDASESGLLVSVSAPTLPMPVLWNPLTGWWRMLPRLEGRVIRYGDVVRLIVENNGCESISFKVIVAVSGSIFSKDPQTALHVFNSVDWKWSSFIVGYIDANTWVFRQRHNELVAYFLACGQPPRFCTFHFASNRLIESTPSSHFRLNTFVVGRSLVVNQSTSGRTRALFLLKTYAEEGHEDLVRGRREGVVQLLEGEEGDEVGSWAWTVVSLLPPGSRLIRQSEDGKTLYIGRGVDLVLHDMDSHKEDMLLGGNYFGEEIAHIWTPSTSVYSQTKR